MSTAPSSRPREPISDLFNCSSPSGSPNVSNPQALSPSGNLPPPVSKADPQAYSPPSRQGTVPLPPHSSAGPRGPFSHQGSVPGTSHLSPNMTAQPFMPLPTEEPRRDPYRDARGSSFSPSVERPYASLASTGHYQGSRVWTAPADYRELPASSPIPTLGVHEPSGLVFTVQSVQLGSGTLCGSYETMFLLSTSLAVAGVLKHTCQSKLFFGAKWFCSNGLRDLQGIAVDYADQAGNLPCGVPIGAFTSKD